MKILNILTALLLAVGLMGVTGFTLPSDAASAATINRRVQNTLQDFREDVRDGSQVLSRARGILVFPRVYKGGFIFGGEYGEGALLVNGATNGYYNIASLSYGFQIGGQRKSMIIAFMTDDALESFRNSSGWEIGPNATVTIANVGAEGELDLTALNQPIVAFVFDQRGIMGGISLEGTKITRINK